MNTILYLIVQTLRRIKDAMGLAAAVAAVTAVTSCSMMHDDMKDCRQELRVSFRYDMNMLYADAFDTQVRQVKLYAYDADGRLAYSKTEPTADIAARGGYMTLDRLQPGRYTLKVWAEGDTRHNDTYAYGQPTAERGDISALDARIKRSTRNVGHDLTPLFHGLVANADLTMDGYGVKTVCVPLTKDTNVVRVVLQNASGAKLNADDFSFAIDDDNTWLAYDNQPLKDDSVTYTPWSKYDGTVDNNTTKSTTPLPKVATQADGDATQMSAVVAELTVNRLLTEKHPRLRVTSNTDGHTVFNIPLIDYALLVKGNYNKQMGNQEYLDRQDQYSFIFFIDDSHNWLSASIYVNSWRVVLNHTDM